MKLYNNIINFFKKQKINEVYFAFFILLSGVFVIQSIMVIYFNLFDLGNHLAYDSAWSVLKPALMWREKAIISDNWAEQTGLYFDSVIPIAAILYGITGNILFSYGLGNLLILALILLCLRSILRTLGVDSASILIAMNLVICPYLLNGFYELNYWGTIVTCAAFYAGRCFLFLFILKCLFDIRRCNKFTVFSYISLPLCVVSGISVGLFMALILLLPCLIFLFINVLRENSVKCLKNKESIYVYLCIACILLGKIICKYILKIELIDSSRTWTGISSLWNNFLSVVYGFIELIGFLPVDGGTVIDKKSIWYIFPMIIGVALIISLLYFIVICIKNIKSINMETIILPIIVVVNIIVFSLFNATYGAIIFEERYLICAFYCLIIMLAYALSKINYEFLAKYIFIFILTFSILFTNIKSDKNFIKSANYDYNTEKIISTVKTTDSKLVYVWYESWEYTLTLGRVLRVLDLDTVYQCYDGSGFSGWGDYKYYQNNEEYQGQTLIIADKNRSLPEEILSDYKLYAELDNVNIYICDYNPINRK